MISATNAAKMCRSSAATLQRIVNYLRPHHTTFLPNSKTLSLTHIRRLLVAPSRSLEKQAANRFPGHENVMKTRELHAVLVLQNVGPVVGPGLPEWGSIAMPRQTVDARAWFAFRTPTWRARRAPSCCTSVPEAAVGGPFALVHTGDFIELNVPERRSMC